MKNLIAFFILLSAINVNANDLSSIQEDLVLEKNPVVIIWSHGQNRPQKSEKCSSRFNKIPKTLKYLEKEINGRGGLDPTRYGDWEKNGRCIDF